MSPLAVPTGTVEIVNIHQNDVGYSLVNDIRNGLNPPAGSPRSMPTMLLYDAQGLKLFEEITYQDEYYLTNAEIEVLETHAKRIVEYIPNKAQILELGSGNLRKIEILLRELERVGKDVDYYALDLSLSELQRTFAEVSVDRYQHVRLHGLHGTYDDALEWLGPPESRSRPAVILSMGSSLGNFSRPEAAGFLAQFAKLLGPADHMAIGLDSCEDPDRVYKAYNDTKGVTRQFYENGLAHANAVLGHEAFKPGEWDVVTEYDPVGGRHQAFYSPKKDMVIEGAHLRKGEKLVFEEAFKYSAHQREDLWRSANLVLGTEFGNGSGEYHIHLLSSAAFRFPTSVSEYAPSAVPTLKEWESLWTAWDVATKSMVPREELLSKPIKLRNALIFYLGHIPTFLDIHLTRALSGKPTEPRSYQQIFERGIDPDVDNPEQCHKHSEIPDEWPPLGEILDYQNRVRSRVRAVCQRDDLGQNRSLGEALWIGFEHEAMHLETFLYMLLQSDRTLAPAGVERPDFQQIFDHARKHAKANEWFTVPERTLAIGLDDDGSSVPPVSFGWDNEKPERTVTVAAFEARAQPITNSDYFQYLQANPHRRPPASWTLAHTDGPDSMSRFAVRTLFGPVPLDLAQDWPLIASYEELDGYAQSVKCRIPTMEEVRSIYVHAAALQTEGRGHINGTGNGEVNGTGIKEVNGNGFKEVNGNGLKEVNGNGVHKNGNGHSKINPTRPRSPDHQPVQPISREGLPVYVELNGHNVGFQHWHPTPVIAQGDRLAGQGDFGGVWEWTSTALAAHEGFRAMEIYPGYTSDFFDGKHHVVLGGSWATHPRIAGRSTFVNWYQTNYPYAWAGGRLVRDV